MLDVHLPDLTFPTLTYGKAEIPWDLRRWLYKCGAGTSIMVVAGMIDAGLLGRPLVGRIELVRQIHEVLLNCLDRGGSRRTVKTRIERLTLFFQWADDATGIDELSLASVEQIYRHWCDSLLHRVRVGQGLIEQTAYDYGSHVGWVLDRVFGRGNPIVKTTRLRRPKLSLRAVSHKADKQNLGMVFKTPCSPRWFEGPSRGTIAS